MSAASPDFRDEEIAALLETIYSRYQYDFRSYAMASLRRRLRVALDRLHLGSLAALHALIEVGPDEFASLLQFLTVQVSDMFRDPTFFRYFREQIVPVLHTYPSLKIWIAGCGMGEEVYSFAILLREEGLLDRTILYATDISPAALDSARAGVYPLERIALFTENHRKSGATHSLSEHYQAAYGAARFDPLLRRNIVFSDHSLATDSVFAEINVVSCRNVLIYFNRELQNRALALMTDSLCRRGFLGLGDKETIKFSAHADRYATLATDQRWYQLL
jgi:chemotaxis protein methyltransferase CheR